MCRLWRRYSQWPVIVSSGETMASLVLYMYKMWLLAGWRVHGQVSSITYNIYFIFRSFLKNWTRLLLLNCIQCWASRFWVNFFCHKLCSMEIDHCNWKHFFFIFRDGKPYCEKDYQAEFGVTCAGCGGYIIGKVLQVK